MNYTEQQYDEFDRIIRKDMTMLYERTTNKDNIVLLNVKPSDKAKLYFLNVACLWSYWSKKNVYIDCNIIDYFIIKHFLCPFLNYHRYTQKVKYNAFFISSASFSEESSDIFNAYYKISFKTRIKAKWNRFTGWLHDLFIKEN